ncbi:High mobility group B protein 15 [Hibiscus syriacus]|uniref:High mobility group B protein 15 n=1 Tax=Hibiscus syriacus TaxID=106335 RepID=A0A6A3CEY1_HIBSY|nr:high mobility group B protein 15-like [Hibiscus syriacus]KAE8725968.1 High mobility group B protein 15 [Hibiscus syriacus]
MASTSFAKHSAVPMKKPVSSYSPYPPPLARYEDVVASPKLFLATLEKLHGTMGTKFTIPIIGGKELDLHKLFLEVTSRGGIEKLVRERRWKEVTAIFNFPSTATNASFVLRKYYVSLLHHYEQIYFFKARGWIPVPSDPLRNQFIPPIPTHGAMRPAVEIHADPVQQPRVNIAESPAAGRPASTTGCPVIGVIDGKFESGYLVTVTIGSEKLKGVLYQASQDAASQVPHQYGVYAGRSETAYASSGVQRRRRRKKSEIKRRDPAHPKPNRSGYNFFFAEQHARLKPLHHGKDREISRMIGELWNKLTESEKRVYQDKALKDKERYRIEMEDYRERLRTGQVISDAVPLQQRLPEPDVEMTEADMKLDETEGGDSPETQEHNSSSDGSDSKDDKTRDKDLDREESLVAGVGSKPMNDDVEISGPGDREVQD